MSLSPAGAIRARLIRRRAVDRWAVRHVAGARVVIAPTLGARRTFAAARRSGATVVLMADLPQLRGLHADLDSAARQHPTLDFLRNHRASPGLVARQEAERVLADHILVRGEHARGLWGPASHVIATTGSGLPFTPTGGRRVLLAGLAAARSGFVEAFSAVAGVSGATLLVRPGGGTEPRTLLASPNVQIVSRAQQLSLDDVDCVVAPAWCESYPEEVRLAVQRGIPVIATSRAAGPCDVPLVEPGAVIPLRDAIQRALSGASLPAQVSGFDIGKVLARVISL